MVDEWFGWSFGFVGDSTGATVEPAIYDLNFKVTETCTGEYFGSPPPGITVDQYFAPQITEDKLKEMIWEEEGAPEPLVILSDGSAVSLSSKSLNFDQFLTKETLEEEYGLARSSSGPPEDKLNWVMLVIPFALGLVLVVTVGVVCYLCRRNRVMVEMQTAEMQRQIDQAEQEGVKVPDDLKKSVRARSSTLKAFMVEDDLKKSARATFEEADDGKLARNTKIRRGIDNIEKARQSIETNPPTELLQGRMEEVPAEP